jgi:hypothetical protein
VESDTHITAIVPAGAMSGPISVTAGGTTATSAASFTVTASGTVLTFAPDADTWIQSDTPDANFGSKQVIKVDDSPVKDGLLRFTVSGVGSSMVASAVLRLYCTDGSSDGGSVYRVADNGWDETTVTWNTAPTSDVSPIGSLGPVATGAWATLDVTSLVVGDGTYSVEIAKGTTNAAFYSTKEGASGLAAQLAVTLS